MQKELREAILEVVQDKGTSTQLNENANRSEDPKPDDRATTLHEQLAKMLDR